MAESRTARRVFFAVLVIGLIVMAVRVRFGIEWFGDEANALAEPMRYAMGDLPIVDSWHTQFSSGLFLTPLVRLLMSVFHDGTGLVTGFRMAYVVMQAGLALAVWRILRRAVSEWGAAAIALTVFFYAPYFYVFPYYNSIAIAALLVSTLAAYAAFTAEGGAGRPMLALAGVAFAVAVIVYPTMLAVVPFTVVGVLGYTRSRHGSFGAVRSPILFLLGVVFGVLLLYAATVVAIASRGDLLASLPHFLHPIDRDMSLGALVARFVRTRAVIGASAVCLVTLAAGLVAARRTRLSSEVAVAIAALAACAFALVAPYLPHSLLYYMDIQQSAILAVALILPVLVIVRPDESVRAAFWLITVPALGAAAGTALVSYEGFETATMPMIVGAVGTLVVLFQWAGDRSDEPRGRWARLAPWIATASVFAVLAGTTLSLTGGDAPVWRLDTTIGSGPYSSIRTTASGAQRYGRYMDLLTPLARSGGRIAFVGEFPLGYVLTGSRPGTYSIWTTFPTGGLWQSYLDITGNHPSTIVSTRFVGPNGGRVSSPYAPPFGLDAFDARYRETFRDDEFVVYRRRTGQ